MNGGWGKGLTGVIDVQGFNYNIVQYDPFRKKFPEMPTYGSETASTVSTRGVFETDKAKGFVSAYDVNHTEWAHRAESAWRPIAERDYMAGTFVWTGFDYKGEPTPYGWPCVNSHFGILDVWASRKTISIITKLGGAVSRSCIFSPIGIGRIKKESRSMSGAIRITTKWNCS